MKGAYFMRLIRIFLFLVSCLTVCGTLQAAAEQFSVSPSNIAFGDMQFGSQAKNLKFVVKNLQTTPLVVNVAHASNFFSVNPSGQVTLTPGETKSVEVIFPLPPPMARCDLASDSVTVTTATQRAVVSVSAKLICADLDFVGSSLNLSIENRQIKVRFIVINVGTAPSNACTGVVLVDDVPVQNFEIPAFTDRFSVPANQKGFSLFVRAAPGPRQVQVRVDTNNQNKEPREDNNKEHGAITVP
jgi:hypothetical protein